MWSPILPGAHHLVREGKIDVANVYLATVCGTHAVLERPRGQAGELPSVSSYLTTFLIRKLLQEVLLYLILSFPILEILICNM